MRIIIYKSKFLWLKQKYRFCLVARNGEIIATSEAYYNLKDCEDTAMLIKLSTGKSKIIYDFDRDED